MKTTSYDTQTSATMGRLLLRQLVKAGADVVHSEASVPERVTYQFSL